MSNLKELVNETTNIKNELVACHTNLKNNLIEKEIECSNNDKMLNLISKIRNIELGKKWAKGTGTFSHSDNIDLTVNNLSFNPSIIILKYTMPKGSVISCFSKDFDKTIMVGGYTTQVSLYQIKPSVVTITSNGFSVLPPNSDNYYAGIRNCEWYTFE